MEKKVISFLGGLNKDDNGINFPDSDYKSASNIIIETDESGNGIAIKKMNSTKQISSNIAPHFSKAEFVASIKDTDNSAYILLKGKTNAGTTAATIIKVKIENSSANVTNIISHYDYDGCSIIPDMTIVGDRLIWNFMGEGVPMMIQISKEVPYPLALKNQTPSYNDLTLIKAPPILQLKITENINLNTSFNVFSEHVYQFASRYVYVDKEVSVLSSISPVFSGKDGIESIKVELNENEVLPTKAEKVEYYVREGNSGVWFLIDCINLNEVNKFTIYKGLKSLALATAVSAKQFDFVPYATKNIESVNNLIFLGNNRENLPPGDAKTSLTISDQTKRSYNPSVTSISLLDGGSYTSVPSVSVTGNATATATLSPLGGSGYQNTPTVNIYGGDAVGGGSISTTVNKSNGVITSITVSGHKKYRGVPQIKIWGNGSGSGAYAEVVMGSMVNGARKVSSIVLVAPVASVSVNSAGSGYTTAPTVTFPTGINNRTALATALISDTGFDGTKYSYYSPTPFISNSYSDYSLNGNGLNSHGFNIDLEEETKPFANGSLYEVGIVLFDEYMRTRGVENTIRMETSDFGFNKKTLNITKKDNWPYWAKYFQVAVTDNLTKDFIYDGYASGCYFIAEASNDIILSTVADQMNDDNEVGLLITEYNNLPQNTSESSARGIEILAILSTEYGIVYEAGNTIFDQITPDQYLMSYKKKRPESKQVEGLVTPTPFLPKASVKASDIRDKIKYFVVDISGMMAAERFYTFQVGDQIIGNFDQATDLNSYQTLRIIAQDGNLLLCDPSPLINVEILNNVEKSLFFEIYSPSEANKSIIYYGNRDVYDINDIRGTGEKNINLEGDCYYTSISLPNNGASKMVEEVNTYSSPQDIEGDNSTDYEAAKRLRIDASTDIPNVSTSFLSVIDHPYKDVSPLLWTLKEGKITINQDGLYTFEYSGNFGIYYYANSSDSTSNTETYIAENMQIGLHIDGESVRYADLQDFTTSTTGFTTFTSTSTVYLYAGEQVSISHQKTDELLDLTASPYNTTISYRTYYVSGISHSITISKDAISEIPFAKRSIKRGAYKSTYSGDIFDPTDKGFIIKDLSRSGKISNVWNKDHGKPYIKYNDIDPDFIKNRVRYSGRYIDGGASSLLSSFSFNDVADLPIEIGKINALIRTSDQQSNGTVVLAMGDTDTFSLYIDRAMVSTADGADLTTMSNKVINNIYPLKGGYGCQDKPSVIRKHGKVFYWDRVSKLIVRYASEGLEPIEKNMRSYFKDKTSVKAAYYDPFYDMIFINFSNDDLQKKTLAYSDKLKRFISEFDVSFTGSFYIGNNAYVFSEIKYQFQGQNRQIQRLFETRTGENYGNFFNIETVAKIKLTSNSILPVNVGHIQIKTKNYLDFTSV
jgi:hypothetical protein